MINIALVIAVLMGLSIAFQPITNAAASRYIGLAPLMIISNGLVFLGSIIYAVLSQGRGKWENIPTMRLDLLLGGAIYGLLILFGGIYVFPRLGATLAIIVIVLSQIIFGLIIDHYGLYGIPRQSLSLVRIIGVFFIFMGILLVQSKFPSS